MFPVLVTAVFIAIRCTGAESQVGQEKCESEQLDHCLLIVPPTRVGLPRNKEELDAYCNAYYIGTTCIENFMKRCLPIDKQQFVRKKIAGASAVMRFLCANDTALRREYLRQQPCWTHISSGWSHCSNEFQGAVEDIIESPRLKIILNREGELCCAREKYLDCVTYVARSCTEAGYKLLHQLAFVMAQDVIKCPEERSYCAAPPPPYATPLLSTLITLLLYLLTF